MRPSPFGENPAASVTPPGATPWAWRPAFPTRERGGNDPGAGSPSSAPLPPEFFLGSAAEVASRLLGCRVRSTVGGVETSGVVVEVEVYLGPEDPASHAATRVGPTQRNRSMFGPPGRAYVYRSHGVHWCLNAVTGPEGEASAVLIRALDPLTGLETMRRRRKGVLPLCTGPGRLAQALAITGELDGHPLDQAPLELLPGWPAAPEMVAVSGRVGVRKAAQWPLRFYLRGHPGVSRGPGEARGRSPDP